MGKTKRALISILLAILVWAFLMPLLPWLLNTISSFMTYNNLTKVTIPLQTFNATSGKWQTTTYVVDLGGLLNVIIVIIVFLAPVLILLSVVRS